MITFTTALPDVDDLVLDASVEDELTSIPETTPSLNHGEFEHEYRESGASTWQAAGTTQYDSAAQPITGLEDGEKYDVRVRSQTSVVTGVWYEASAVTLLPAPGQPSFANVTETAVDIAWIDNADNENDQVIRRERSDQQGFVQVATVAADVESDTDDSVLPGYEYSYVVRTRTEHVVADSPSASVETPASGRPQTRSRQSQWVVEVADPDRSGYRRATVTGTPRLQPRLNGRPAIRVPIPADESWLRDGLLEKPVRVWYDGTRLPYDELRDVSPGPATYELLCTAGRQLTEYVQLQVDEEENHVVAADLITEHTEYALEIDDPDSETRSDVLLANYTGTADFESLFSGQLEDDTIPLYYDNTEDDLRTYQTAWFEEAEDAANNGFTVSADGTFSNPGAYSDGQAIRLSSTGDYVEVTFTPNYDIPAGNLDVAILYACDGDSPPDFEFYNTLNTQTAAYPGSQILNTAGPFDLEYQKSGAGLGSTSISAGTTVTVGVEVAASGDDVYVDVIAPLDNRYSYTMDDSPSNDLVDGPELHPDGIDLETPDVQSVEQILEATLNVTMDAVDGQQAIALSADQGASWTSAANTASLTEQYDPSVSQVRSRVTLSRTGQRDTTSPATGFKSQVLSAIEIRADLDDTPVLYDKVVRGRLEKVLADAVADPGDYVWEIERDPAAAWDDPDGLQFAMTQAGQRTRSRVSESLVEWSGTKTVEGRYDKIIVRGGSRRIDGEDFFADVGGNEQTLDNSPVVVDSERVYDPATGETFERNVDYTMDYEAGNYQVPSGSSMTDGETYEIDYEERFIGEAKTPGVAEAEATTREERIPNARSDTECQQLALGILRRVQEPLVEVEVTVATSDPTISLLEAINHPELPIEGSLVPREQSVSPGEVTLTLGTRRGFKQIVEELQSGIRELADAV
jgi:hypothetical protein